MSKSKTRVKKPTGGSTLKILRKNLKTLGLLTRPSAKQSKKASKSKASAVDDRLEKLKKLKERVNPFALKFKREKHNVLGKKRAEVAGKPVESRTRGHEKRKNTLLVELQNKDKVNVFKDKRFGENNPDMTPEERMMERFALEKKSRAEKSAIYNLDLDDNEEELTHFGQALSSLSNIDDHDPRMDDEEFEGKDYTKDLHFGGFHDGENKQKKSYKEIMEEVIAKSKFHKIERQKIKEETENLRQDLNEEFDEIRNILFDEDMQDQKPEEKSKIVDDYDKFVRELVFEKRAKPTDRLKTEEEIAKEEAERLLALEKKRLRGMNAQDSDEEQYKTSKKESGDALGELDFYNGDNGEYEENEALYYKDGKLMNPEKLFMKEKTSKESEDELEMFEDEDEDEDELSDDEDEEDVSDFEGSEDEIGESEEEGEETAEENSDSDAENEEKSAKDEPKGIPYVIAIPSSLDELKETIADYSLEDQQTIIERIMTLHHPSLNESNPAKLQKFLCILIDFLCSTKNEEVETLGEKSTLCFSLIIKLAFQYPEIVSKHIKLRLKQVHDRFKKKKQLEIRDIIIFLLISRLFPTSDYRHDVVLSMYLLIGEVLCQLSYRLNASFQHCIKKSQLPEQTKELICCGLFLCQIFLDAQSLSKRYMPEVMYFLNKCVDLLDIAVENKNLNLKDEDKPLEFKYLVSCDKVEESTLLAAVCKTVKKYAELYIGKDVLEKSSSGPVMMAGVFLNPSTHEGWAWEDVFNAFYRKNAKSALVKDLVDNLSDTLNQILKDRRNRCVSVGLKAGRPPLQWQKKIIKEMKSVEPKFDSKFNPDRKSKTGGGVDEDEEKKMTSLYKKEMKGAIRELKRDARFLASEKLKEMREKDSAYKNMVKRIEGSLGNEKGEAKAEHVVKKRKKK